uniref:Uncharacterized protein n=1 Tax=Hyaloperonospora arabidopsidis (strain Emoy2) TaxID=559515 RepID=M4C2P2_HYAAE
MMCNPFTDSLLRDLTEGSTGWDEARGKRGRPLGQDLQALKHPLELDPLHSAAIVEAINARLEPIAPGQAYEVVAKTRYLRRSQESKARRSGLSRLVATAWEEVKIFGYRVTTVSHALWIELSQPRHGSR